MKNLLVMHTQYNLILACGLAEREYSSDQNDLILFCDFALSMEMKGKLQSVFDKVLYLSGSYPKANEKYWNKIRRYPAIFRAVNQFIKEKYERVLLVDDQCLPEHYIMKRAGAYSREVSYAWVEDGGIAYFSNNVVSRGLGANHVSRMVRRMLFKYGLALGRYYDLPEVMGGHKLLRTAYVTYPPYVREHLKHKELIEISKESFLQGMLCLYAGDRFLPDRKFALIILDMLSVYGVTFNEVRSALKDVINLCAANGMEVYYKYHPREEDCLEDLKPFKELDRKVAVESLLVNSLSAKTVVFGIKSTGLQTARKMGFRVVSLLKVVEPDNHQVIDFYRDIGVDCPNVAEIIKINWGGLE